MNDLFIFLALIALGYYFGRRNEQSHFKSIQRREKELRHITLSTMGKKAMVQNVENRGLVCGHTVVGQDYFKQIAGSLRNLVGGRVKSYESLLDRARREALLRLKSEAAHKGADLIVNLRIETSTIGQNNGRHSGSIEALAYATAVKRNTP